MFNRYLMYAPMAVFGLTGLLLYQYFMAQNTEAGFRDNIVPELIGFCLEGFFWIGMLSYFQKTRELQRKSELWLSLRGSLRSFLSYLDIGFLDENAEPISSQALENDPEIVSQLIEKLHNQKLDLESLTLLKRNCLYSLPLVRDLVPVAAQLSASHMRWWIAISDDMRRVGNYNDRENIEKHVMLLLKNIEEFDALSY